MAINGKQPPASGKPVESTTAVSAFTGAPGGSITSAGNGNNMNGTGHSFDYGVDIGAPGSQDVFTSATFTVSLSMPIDEDMLVSLSNGDTVTIPKGSTSVPYVDGTQGDGVYIDPGQVSVSIASAVPQGPTLVSVVVDTDPAVVSITDTIDPVIVKLSATPSSSLKTRIAAWWFRTDSKGLKMVSVKELDRNEMLYSLPLELREGLAASLEPISLADGQIFREVGARNSMIVFPLSCIVSMDYVLKDSFSAEFLIVGNEGVIGLESLFDQRPGPVRIVALQGGMALRMDKDELRRKFLDAEAIQQSVFQYTCADPAHGTDHHLQLPAPARSANVPLDSLGTGSLAVTSHQDHP